MVFKRVHHLRPQLYFVAVSPIRRHRRDPRRQKLSINPAAVGQLHRVHAQAATEAHGAAPVPRPTALGEVRTTRNHGNQSTRLRLPSEGVVASLTMKNDTPLFPVVSEGWDFGMSPPKPRWPLSPLTCELW